MKTQKACWATAMLGIVAANAVSPLQQEVPILEPVKEVPPSTGGPGGPLAEGELRPDGDSPETTSCGRG